MTQKKTKATKKTRQNNKLTLTTPGVVCSIDKDASIHTSLLTF